jgi:methylated-DNA-[protein]-cysteine S-methyltransferase
MRTIVKSDEVRAELTRYSVSGWGEGELWTGGEVVLAHDFRFAAGVEDTADAEADGQAAGELVQLVRAFFDGGDVPLAEVTLDLDSSTPFQRAVTIALRAIPRGEVVTYGELAALAGYPNAARAVGTVCARNPFMLFVPCHRVVAATGIGPYGSAGVAVKRRLLALEGVEL